jgi:hypothetical protein
LDFRFWIRISSASQSQISDPEDQIELRLKLDILEMTRVIEIKTNPKSKIGITFPSYFHPETIRPVLSTDRVLPRRYEKDVSPRSCDAA